MYGEGALLYKHSHVVLDRHYCEDIFIILPILEGRLQDFFCSGGVDREGEIVSEQELQPARKD